MSYELHLLILDSLREIVVHNLQTNAALSPTHPPTHSITTYNIVNNIIIYITQNLFNNTEVYFRAFQSS